MRPRMVTLPELGLIAGTRAALGARYEAKGLPGPKKKGARAFPTIAAARVEIGGRSATVKARATEQSASVRLVVPAGRTTLKAWFQDETGAGLCGAFFVTVVRKK